MSGRGLKEGASCPSEDGVSLAVWTPPSVGLARRTAHGAGGEGRGGRLASGCRAWVPGSRGETRDTEDKEGLCLWNQECTEPEETASS